MYKRAGGQIRNGETYIWTNFYLDGLYYDQPYCKMDAYTVPDEWLGELFDNNYSAHLMPFPQDLRN
uniref:Uncharacterized protein n=1 Tax=viral metagenome TaxID=1070528 RepID=A0A6M3K0L3_9ZZZZ